MTGNPTVSELREAAEVTDAEVDAATDTVLADHAVEAHPLAAGWSLNLVEAIVAHEAAQDALLTDQDAAKRAQIRTAIFQARPVRR